jgi:hypothetical protein
MHPFGNAGELQTLDRCVTYLGPEFYSCARRGDAPVPDGVSREEVTLPLCSSMVEAVHDRVRAGGPAFPRV